MLGRLNKARIFFLLIALFVPIRGVVAQDPTVTLESGLVTIDVTVMDTNGNYVIDLQQDDFTLTRDGAVQPIVFFESQQNRTLTRPLSVVFALDVSGSLGTQVRDQQYAAKKFIKLVQPDSVFAVIGFNDKVQVYRKFTSDPEKLQEGFAKAKRIGGRTRLYDAIDRAITMLDRDAPVWRNGRRLRRVVIVITDGFDYTSLIDRKEVIRRANDAGVTIYSITLPSYIMSPQGKQRVPTLLDASGIVDQTGGIDFPAEERDFALMFRAIAEEIRASYTVAFYPDQGGKQDESHQIKLTTRRAGMKLRQSRYSYTPAALGQP